MKPRFLYDRGPPQTVVETFDRERINNNILVGPSTDIESCYLTTPLSKVPEEGPVGRSLTCGWDDLPPTKCREGPPNLEGPCRSEQVVLQQM